MILDTTSKVLEIILGAAKTTNDCEFTADYVDTQNGATFAPGGNIGVSNGTTLVTAVSAPAASTQRSVRAFTFMNNDTVNTTVTVRIYDGTNRRRIVTLTITPGQSLVFTPEAGWSILPSTNGQIPGTSTNDNAAAGNVGEFISSNIPSTSAITSASGTVTNVTSLNLTAGDWDVEGLVGGAYAGNQTPSFLTGWVSTTSATLPTLANSGGMFFNNVPGLAGGGICLSTGKKQFLLASTTVVYLSGRSDYAGGVGNAALYGFICARRAR